jgi:ribonuclease inhibitor
MNTEIDGINIKTEAEFHAAISRALSLPARYGRNLDALFDVLSGDVERPIVLVWKNSSISESSMGDVFERIVNVLRKIERQDIEWDLDEIFELRLN